MTIFHDVKYIMEYVGNVCLIVNYQLFVPMDHTPPMLSIRLDNPFISKHEGTSCHVKSGRAMLCHVAVVRDTAELISFIQEEMWCEGSHQKHGSIS